MTPRCRRLLFVTTALWALASLALFSAGVFYERVQRYDRCDLAFVGATLAYVCPLGEFLKRPPMPPPGGQA